MAMQLFSFGHPCEHQLHRACIGGSNCPLNGYPDTWCCSFIKGKINFKRDRPCEGPRCHWDFVHPTQSQFDEVTQVLEQSRPIAAKLDEAKDTDLLSFQISNPHIIDTVQCALHMMRHPPSSCARRVGQLLAYAAVLAGDQDVFVQLLKTMKKPVDGYILGAYAFLTQSKSGSGGDKGGANQKSSAKKQPKRKDAKDDISATLANIMVELMNAALSLGGQLVDREDQHVLQAMLIKALSTYPKSDKRHQEMLEKAIAKFGNRKLDDEEEAAARREAARREAAAAAAAAANAVSATETVTAAADTSATKDLASAPAAATAAAAAATAEGGEASGEPPATEAEEAPSAPPAAPTTPEKALAPAEAPTEATASGLSETVNAVATTPTMALAEPPSRALPPAPPTTHSSAERPTPRENVSAAATPRTGFSSAPGTPSTAAAATGAAALPGSGPFTVPPILGTTALPPPQQAAAQTPPLTAAAAPTFTTSSANSAAAPPRPPPAPSTASNAPIAAAATVPANRSSNSAVGTTGAAPLAAAAAPSAAVAGPVVGISKVLPALRARGERFTHPSLWPPVDTHGPGPELYICGGQLSVRSQLWGLSPLGEADPHLVPDAATVKLDNYIQEVREERQQQRAAEMEAVEEVQPKADTREADARLRALLYYLLDSEDDLIFDEEGDEVSASDFEGMFESD